MPVFTFPNSRYLCFKILSARTPKVSEATAVLRTDAFKNVLQHAGVCPDRHAPGLPCGLPSAPIVVRFSGSSRIGITAHGELVGRHRFQVGNCSRCGRAERICHFSCLRHNLNQTCDVSRLDDEEQIWGLNAV
jgi:hypothetical protein